MTPSSLQSKPTAGRPAAGTSQLRPRGRRSSFDREQALETALDLFWRYGYEGVSIADLTGRLGIAAPSLYHAFGSKADLYREVLRRYQSMGLSQQDISDAPSSLEAVRRVLTFGVASITRRKRPRGCLVSSGLLTTAPENSALAREVRKERAWLRTALEQRIRRDIEAGVLGGATDAGALARLYVTVLQGMSIQAIDGATTTELTAVVEAALRAWPKQTVGVFTRSPI